MRAACLPPMLPLQGASVRAFKSYGGAAPAQFAFDGGAISAAGSGGGAGGSLTCILGPNGSGKSALLEAVCFALGAPASTMRARALRDVVSTESDAQVGPGGTHAHMCCMACMRGRRRGPMRQLFVACCPACAAACTSARAPSETPHPAAPARQLCEVRVQLARGRNEAHEVAAALGPDGARTFRIDGRIRSAHQVKVGPPSRPRARLPLRVMAVRRCMHACSRQPSRPTHGPAPPGRPCPHAHACLPHRPSCARAALPWAPPPSSGRRRSRRWQTATVRRCWPWPQLASCGSSRSAATTCAVHARLHWSCAGLYMFTARPTCPTQPHQPPACLLTWSQTPAGWQGDEALGVATTSQSSRCCHFVMQLRSACMRLSSTAAS